MIAHQYFQASLVAERTGHWVLARSYAERAKAIYEELRDHSNVGKLLNEIGALNFQLGKPEDAVTYLKQAFKVLIDVGDDTDAGRVISSLAQVHLRTGKVELAEEQARQAADLVEEPPPDGVVQSSISNTRPSVHDPASCLCRTRYLTSRWMTSSTRVFVFECSLLSMARRAGALAVGSRPPVQVLKRIETGRGST
jgi:tetratricopeptide (TPR) repeat protein